MKDYCLINVINFKDMNKFIKYILFSILPLWIDLLIYFILVNQLLLNVYLSFIIAFFFWSIVAFSITPHIFKNKIIFKKYYFKFLLIEIVCVFIWEFIFLYLFYSILEINYFFAKILSVIIIFSFSFFLKNKLFTKK